MKVFLTGGTGNVGKAAVMRLGKTGHAVTVIGRSEGITLAGADYHRCDINDYDRLHALMDSHDAVVHLAAVPGPQHTSGRELFRINNLGTYNIYEAAEDLGIKRVVTASSINAFGYFFGHKNFPVRYLPVDENHEGIATDPYSFSKQVLEKIGSYFFNRSGISGTALRLPGVWSQEQYRENRRSRYSETEEKIKVILSMDDDERLGYLKDLHEKFDYFRAVMKNNRYTQNPAAKEEAKEKSMLSREERSFLYHKNSLLTFVHEEDSAQAIEKSLVSDYEGFHPLYINAARNVLDLEMSDAAKLFWPPVAEIRDQHPGDSCLPSIDAARQLIGYDPGFEIMSG
jgi:nucleoside-diphosphate-sugar epimerase